MIWPTVLVAAIIGGILAAIVLCGLRNRKKGRSSCSCGGNCSACGACRQ